MFCLIEVQINQLLLDFIFYKEMSWHLRQLSPSSMYRSPKLSLHLLSWNWAYLKGEVCFALSFCYLGPGITISILVRSRHVNNKAHYAPESWTAPKHLPPPILFDVCKSNLRALPNNLINGGLMRWEELLWSHWMLHSRLYFELD